MTDSPLLLIYAPSLRNHDGTTVQLRRLLADFPVPVWHLHGPSGSSFTELPGNCVSLEVPLEPRYPFRRGAGFLRRSWRRWWVPRFVRSQLTRARREHQASAPRVAYVVIYDELNDNLDTYVDRRDDIRKPLKTVIEADTEFQAKLRALKDASGVPAEEPKLYEFVLTNALETVDSSAEEHRTLLTEQEEAAKQKKLNPRSNAKSSGRPE